MQLYPLTFEPIVLDKLWGGQKLSSLLGKDAGDKLNIGETWEISGVEGQISVVKKGALRGENLQGLISEFGSSLLGKKVLEEFKGEFPLLFKFIDADRTFLFRYTLMKS